MPSYSSVGGTRSTFGDQSTSRANHRGKSAPSFGFGSGTRDAQEKVFVSHEHAKLAVGGASRSPGPAMYALSPSVGRQVNSGYHSSAEWSFGSADRFNGMNTGQTSAHEPGPGAYDAQTTLGHQVSSKNASAPTPGFGSATREHVAKVYISEEQNKAFYGSQSPGPMAAYKIPAAVGKQVNGRMADQPTWVFGTSERFSYEHVKRAQQSPGPGNYPIPAAVGPQVTSTKPSTPRFGFGSSNREHMERVYISAEHDRLTAGRGSPGPGQYPMQPSTGEKQVASNLQTSARFGFGTSQRFANTAKTSFTPGPGSYVV